jgi:hypothetical protein
MAKCKLAGFCFGGSYMKKTCSKCNLEKEISEFKKRSDRTNQYKSKCSTCLSEYYKICNKEYRSSHKKKKITAEKAREYYDNFKNKHPTMRTYKRETHLLYSYGIALIEYDNLHKSQDGLCAICGKQETKKNITTGETVPLSVDHDHVSGKIRGLLCNHCNHAIGNLKDNPELLRKAADYLELFINRRLLPTPNRSTR